MTLQCQPALWPSLDIISVWRVELQISIYVTTNQNVFGAEINCVWFKLVKVCLLMTFRIWRHWVTFLLQYQFFDEENTCSSFQKQTCLKGSILYYATFFKAAATLAHGVASHFESHFWTPLSVASALNLQFCIHLKFSAAVHSLPQTQMPTFLCSVCVTESVGTCNLKALIFLNWFTVLQLFILHTSTV